MGYCWIYAWNLCIKGMQSAQAATYWRSNVHVAICLYNPFQRHIRCWYNAKYFLWRSSIEGNWHDRALVINCVYLYRSIFHSSLIKSMLRVLWTIIIGWMILIHVAICIYNKNKVLVFETLLKSWKIETPQKFVTKFTTLTLWYKLIY